MRQGDERKRTPTYMANLLGARGRIFLRPDFVAITHGSLYSVSGAWPRLIIAGR